MSSAGNVDINRRNSGRSARELKLEFCHREDIRAKNGMKKLLQLCSQIKHLSLFSAVHVDLPDLLRRPLPILEENHLTRGNIGPPSSQQQLV
jgi:hypothetical protein